MMDIGGISVVLILAVYSISATFVILFVGTRKESSTFLEGIDGVTSVSITPLRYAELLAKEEELNDLKLEIKRINQ